MCSRVSRSVAIAAALLALASGAMAQPAPALDGYTFGATSDNLGKDISIAEGPAGQGVCQGNKVGSRWSAVMDLDTCASICDSLSICTAFTYVPTGAVRGNCCYPKVSIIDYVAFRKGDWGFTYVKSQDAVKVVLSSRTYLSTFTNVITSAVNQGIDASNILGGLRDWINFDRVLNKPDASATVLAPMDQAFADEGLSFYLLSLDPVTLKRTALCHVINQSLQMSDMLGMQGQEIFTLDSRCSFIVQVDDNNLSLIGQGDAAGSTITFHPQYINLPAGNSWVHVVETVVLL